MVLQDFHAYTLKQGDIYIYIYMKEQNHTKPTFTHILDMNICNKG